VTDITFDPAALDRTDAYHLLNSLVVPRPIAWVSTLGEACVANIAPQGPGQLAGEDPSLALPGAPRRVGQNVAVPTQDFISKRQSCTDGRPWTRSTRG
jgi:hypothetical protein